RIVKVWSSASRMTRSAARRLAEAGCSAHEIMAVTGHKTLSEVERYTRAAEQERLNAAAMAKQLENEKVANSLGQIGKHIEAKEKKSRMALPRGLGATWLNILRAVGLNAYQGIFFEEQGDLTKQPARRPEVGRCSSQRSASQRSSRYGLGADRVCEASAPRQHYVHMRWRWRLLSWSFCNSGRT